MDKAKRGDLVVIQCKDLDSIASKGRDHDRFTVGIVTNITRDGLVKGYQEIGYAGSLYQMKIDVKSPRRHDKPVGFVKMYVQSQGQIDVQAALEAAKENRWSVGGTQGMPFDSIEAVKAALKPCLRKS